ncbi:MAG: hypothetical protein K6B43_13740 [Treponema sp.]|nr:hypothetical protein [Treponema sp.]
MGAIWDFISGKSTDWDAVNRQQEAYERTRPRRIKYRAYCKICGTSTYISRGTPGEAIHELQQLSGATDCCGQNNHTPEVERVEE